jgi:hypothetical protein
MNDYATVSGNQTTNIASFGGGVWVFGNSTFNMSDVSVNSSTINAKKQ